MRFWDSSAVLPLLLDEPFAARVQGLLERDAVMVVSWATPIECWSAVARARREDRISAETEERAVKLLEMLQKSWYEVTPSEAVRRQSRRLLRIHPLRAADALQLAAAIVWSGQQDGSEFVSFDARLREAARREGFALL